LNYETIRDNFVENLKKRLGETVTIITQGGGDTGLGFTGAVFAVNNSFVRLVTRIGGPPSNCGNKKGKEPGFQGANDVGGFCSFADIPIDKIISVTYYSA
jgi:hypothetical protein